MALDHELIGVLLALYLLTDGRADDSVPLQQLQTEVGNDRQPPVDQAVAKLVKMGLAEAIFISEGVTWIGITARGCQVARLEPDKAT